MVAFDTSTSAATKSTHKRLGLLVSAWPTFQRYPFGNSFQLIYSAGFRCQPDDICPVIELARLDELQESLQGLPVLYYLLLLPMLELFCWLVFLDIKRGIVQNGSYALELSPVPTIDMGMRVPHMIFKFDVFQTLGQLDLHLVLKILGQDGIAPAPKPERLIRPALTVIIVGDLYLRVLSLTSAGSLRSFSRQSLRRCPSARALLCPSAWGHYIRPIQEHLPVRRQAPDDVPPCPVEL